MFLQFASLELTCLNRRLPHFIRGPKSVCQQCPAKELTTGMECPAKLSGNQDSSRRLRSARLFRVAGETSVAP
jgi:hypothetical protein